MRLKSKSSEKIRWRYLLVSGEKKDIENALLDGLGFIGYARAKIQYVLVKNRIVLAIEEKSVIDARAALALNKNALKVERVSGTLKGLGLPS